MPTFNRCDESVNKLATEILNQYETHQPFVAAKARIDYVFAYGDRGDEGELINDALKKNGVKALGITRKIPLKDRALGRGDAEIALDGDWWEDANEEERKALMDHELHHLSVKIDDRGIVTDDLDRPVIKLRHHDYDFGFFKVIAARHREFSQEVKQARTMMDEAGQLFWPTIDESTVTISSGGHTTAPITVSRFSRIVKDMDKDIRKDTETARI